MFNVACLKKFFWTRSQKISLVKVYENDIHERENLSHVEVSYLSNSF